VRRACRRASSGSSASRGCTGRKPPSRSLESVCWLRLSTTSGAPTCARARALHATARLTTGPTLGRLCPQSAVHGNLSVLVGDLSRATQRCPACCVAAPASLRWPARLPATRARPQAHVRPQQRRAHAPAAQSAAPASSCRCRSRRPGARARAARPRPPPPPSRAWRAPCARSCRRAPAAAGHPIAAGITSRGQHRPGCGAACATSNYAITAACAAACAEKDRFPLER